MSMILWVFFLFYELTESCQKSPVFSVYRYTASEWRSSISILTILTRRYCEPRLWNLCQFKRTNVSTGLHIKFCFAACLKHDNVIKWKHFPRYWPFVWGIHRSPVNSPHKGQWRRAFMFSLICAWINRWVNTRETGDVRRYRSHYDVIVMIYGAWTKLFPFLDDKCLLLESVLFWNIGKYAQQLQHNRFDVYLGTSPLPFRTITKIYHHGWQSLLRFHIFVIFTY